MIIFFFNIPFFNVSLNTEGILVELLSDCPIIISKNDVPKPINLNSIFLNVNNKNPENSEIGITNKFNTLKNSFVKIP